MIRQSSSAGTYITRIKNYVKFLQNKEGKKNVSQKPEIKHRESLS